MKKYISLAAQTTLCVLLTTAAFAQSGRTPQNTPKEQSPGTEQQAGNRREEKAPAIPSLTDEQKGQLQTIRQQSRDQIEAVRNDATLSDQERRSRIDSIRQNSREQSQAVLTPEQREAVANQRGNGEGRGNRPTANGQGQSGGNRPQMGGQQGGFGGPRTGQGGQAGGPRGGGGRGGGRP